MTRSDPVPDRKTRLITTLAAMVVNAWFSTCRVRIPDQEGHRRFVLSETSGVGATWHRGAIFAVWFFRKLHPLILFSRSKDGELIAEFARRLGVVPVRGSSSRGGREALREMVRFFSQPGVRRAGTVMDGPRGPRYVAKMGMIALAKLAGVPFVPVMVSAWPAITLKNTWDRTMIPLPFSKVVVLYGDPIHIPRDARGPALEALRLEVEKRLNDMRRQADRISGYRGG
jgi:lysophospholipid acyltransferase (LPLAT)-like uncharacterized protein